MRSFFFTFCFLILADLNHAQTCCSGGVPLSNNIGLSFLDKGAYQIGLFYDYNNLNTLNEGTKVLNDNSRLRITNSILLNFSYNFTDRLLGEGLFTWVNQQREITLGNNVNFDETFGIGDAILLLRYMLVKEEYSSLIIGAGGKIPLGSTEEVNSLGILLNADLQPGSNAFDFIFTSTYTTIFDFRKSLQFHARATYRDTGINSSYLGSSEYKFGNEFQMFVGATDSFLVWKQLVNPSLVFKYRNAQMDQLDTNNVANTGGEWIFMNPSVTIALSPKINFSTRVEIPIYSNVTGVQLTPTYRINTGITFQFGNKRRNESLLN
ncbi:MAG: hypothetical protein MK202_13660 [Tenacibaculum sp.]|nr:hypothetical protein [Tenacibaculum sp.]